MPMVFVNTSRSGRGSREPQGLRAPPRSLVTDSDDIGIFIDGQQLPASLVGTDPGTGLAVVRVHAENALTSVTFASDTTIGYGSFVALVWVDGDGAHACWGSVASLDGQLTSNSNSRHPRVAFDPGPTGGVATVG